MRKGEKRGGKGREKDSQITHIGHVNKQTTCSPFQVKEIVGSLVEDIKIPSISDLPGRPDMH